jgi:hypothetical protein
VVAWISVLGGRVMVGASCSSGGASDKQIPFGNDNKKDEDESLCEAEVDAAGGGEEDLDGAA